MSRPYPNNFWYVVEPVKPIEHCLARLIESHNYFMAVKKKKKKPAMAYEAGVKDNGKHVVWSRHATEKRAIAAAKKYRRGLTYTGPRVGSGFWRPIGGTWVEV